MEGGELEGGRAIVQLVIDPNGGALPSHLSPRALGKWRDRGDCRNEELMNTVPGELDPLESQSNRTYLKHKNYF